MQIAIIGAGSFGTSLAKVLAENQHQVRLWSHSQDTLKNIQEKNENTIYLGGFTLPRTILAFSNKQECVKEAQLVIMVVPSQVTREVFREFLPFIPATALILGASKGIEKGTHKLVSEILEEELGSQEKQRLLFLSGPSFAKELAQKIPTAITIAGHNKKNIQLIQKAFHNSYFRAYGSEDVIGVELGGALKNVIAIATGISDGMEMGNNTRAAIITRGLAEIARLGVKMGGDPITFMGLAGMGDLVLTCTGSLSRNRTVGLKLGQGMSLKQILDDMRMVAEGVVTTESAYKLSLQQKIDMPITRAVYNILYNNVDPQLTIKELMSRDIKFEN